MKTGIGDFAMNLIQEQVSGKKKTFNTAPVIPGGEGKDLRNVKVPDSFYNSVLQESFGIKVEAKPVQETKVSTPVEQPKKVNKTPDQLIAEFSEVLAKAKGLIAEMTTCGMIGVGPAKPKTVDAGKLHGKKYRKAKK